MSKNICTNRTNVDQAYSMFDVINDEFYNGALHKPIIQIAVLYRRIGNSRYVKEKVWKGVNGKDVAEITINSHLVGVNNVEAVFQELLECAIYQYCNQNNIKCTSRNNIYKNERFNDIANTHGLICEKDDKYGYAISGINEIAKSILDKHNWCFLTERDSHVYGNGPKERSSTRNLICEKCGQTSRVTHKNHNIICGFCHTQMVEK